MESTRGTSGTGGLDFLLVNLPFREYLYGQSQQLGLLYVAASLHQAGFTVRVVDDAELDAASFLALYRENRPRIVGFHVNTDAVPSVGRVLAMLRGAGCAPELVIFGGPHVTIEDRTLLENNWGDIVVRGEGELTAPEIGRWFLRGEGQLAKIKGISYRDERGALVRNPDRPFIDDLDGLPFPDPSLLARPAPYPTFQIVTGRGCPFRCTFCAEGIAGIKYRLRSADSVLEEIRRVVGARERVYMGILDDTFLVQRKRVEAIANGLIKEYGGSDRFKWFCEGRVDFIIRNPDLFPLLREAGLVRVQIGIESGSQEILDLYRKQVQVDDIVKAVEILRDGDIPSIYGNFIIGGPHETAETIGESIELARTLIAKAPGRMECASCFLGLYPGTELSLKPDHYGLDVCDPEMMTCISLHHPVATPKGKSKHWVMEQYYRFNEAILGHYQTVMADVSLELIEEHLKLRAYDVTSKWSDLYLNYPCIRQCEYMQKKHGPRNSRVSDAELAELIPRRSVGLLDTTAGRFAVFAHPQGPVILNAMAGKVYELCSGKYRLREIIAVLRAGSNNVPPEPYFSEQVISLVRDMKRRYLLYFSDL